MQSGTTIHSCSALGVLELNSEHTPLGSYFPAKSLFSGVLSSGSLSPNELCFHKIGSSKAGILPLRLFSHYLYTEHKFVHLNILLFHFHVCVCVCLFLHMCRSVCMCVCIYTCFFEHKVVFLQCISVNSYL